MRAFVRVVVCLLCLALALPGADLSLRPRRHWLRRITWAAGCAASFWDAQTTASAARRGALEANPLFADAQGAPRWGRIVAFKAGTCAGSFVVEQIAARRGRSDWYWTAINTAAAGAFTGAAIHNMSLRGRLNKDAAVAAPASQSPN
jgi:hypothetical protein